MTFQTQNQRYGSSAYGSSACWSFSVVSVSLTGARVTGWLRPVLELHEVVGPTGHR